MTVVERGAGPVRNRWVLAGAVLYLLEWVGIVWVSAAGVGSQVVRGTPAGDVVDTYAGNEDAVYSLAGLLAVVLLGRVLVFIGLSHALRDSGAPHTLLDLAVVAAAVSVTLEVGSYGLAASATSFADAGAEELTLAIDQAGAGLNLMIGGGLGVAILCASYVMWRSGFFPTVLNVLGVVAGVAIIGAQLTVAPSLQPVFDVLYFFPVVFWVWMLWAGIVCWRAPPRRTGPSTP